MKKPAALTGHTVGTLCIIVEKPTTLKITDMKIKLLISVLLLFTFSCEKDDNSKSDSKPNSISYESSYSTEPRPISISYKNVNQTLYVANYNPSKNDYSAKIQAFNNEGIHVKTVVDFESFELGNFERYAPVDFTFGKNLNLYILVRPLIKLIDDTWTTPTGFSILQFDNSDSFIRELDFSNIDGEGRPSSISYYKNQLYVTNGQILKQINPETQQVDNITLPVNDTNSGTWPYLHTTDMEINTNGIIYFTGQASFNNDSVGCHLSSYNIESKELTINYAKGWTWMCCAMLNNPGLFISNDGYLYLASFYKMNLEIYDKNIDFIIDCDTRTSQFEQTRPIDIVYFNGKIFVADNFNNQIHVFKQD